MTFMRRLIVPDIFKGKVTAFFTGKSPGADTSAIARLFGIQESDIFMPIQKHTDKIMVLDASREPKIADAVVTGEKGVLIGVQVADCIPILVHDSRKGIVGAVHAGWRGTAAGVLKKTISLLMEKFFCKSDDILLAVGPGIGGCCYEVGPDVAAAVIRATGEGDYEIKRSGKHFLDLARANRQQALSLGLPENNLWLAEECTSCHPDRFYSYRYARGSTGRQGGFIGIMP